MRADDPEMLPGWRRAYEALWSLLPITREHVTAAKSCITPAAVLKYAAISNKPVRFGIIPRWKEHDAGADLYTKAELFDQVFAGVPTFRGELILITDDCFPITAHEPFFGHGETLREFLAEAPFVFDGDAIFIWPTAGRISVFDHEGNFAHINCANHQT